MKCDVFISYSDKDSIKVKEIKSQIDEERGIDSLIDGAKEAIKECLVFLFMLSENSQKEEEILAELDYAKRLGKHIVIINIDSCKLQSSFIIKYSTIIKDYWMWSKERREITDKIARVLTGIPDFDGTKRDTLQVKSFGYRSLEPTIFDYNGNIIFASEFKKRGFARFYMTVYDGPRQEAYVDKKGQVWCGCKCFHEGLAAVMKHVVLNNYGNYLWGYVNEDYRLVIPCRWQVATSFCDGFAKVKDNDGKWWIINKVGEIIEETEKPEEENEVNINESVEEKKTIFSTLRRLIKKN